jgi:hypothetical protein
LGAARSGKEKAKGELQEEQTAATPEKTRRRKNSRKAKTQNTLTSRVLEYPVR